MMGCWSGDLSLRSQSYFLPGKNEEFFKTKFLVKCCIGSYSLANKLKMLDIFGGFPANVKPPAQNRAFQSSRKAWLVAIENHCHHAFAITCLHGHFNIQYNVAHVENFEFGCQGRSVTPNFPALWVSPMKSKCSASVLAVRPHERQHSLIIRIMRGCHSPKHTNWRGVAWSPSGTGSVGMRRLPSKRPLMFDNVFLQDVLLNLSNSYTHEIPMCHTSYTGLFYQYYPQLSTSKTSLLAFNWILKMQPNQGYHKRTNNKWFPFLGINDIFSWFEGLVLPLSTSHTIDLWRFFASVSWKKQSIPALQKRMTHRIQPIQTSKRIIQVHLTCFFSAFKQIPEAPEPSTWRARLWAALRRTSGTAAELF